MTKIDTIIFSQSCILNIKFRRKNQGRKNSFGTIRMAESGRE
jgi:hypothetical protein